MPIPCAAKNLYRATLSIKLLNLNHSEMNAKKMCVGQKLGYNKSLLAGNININFIVFLLQAEMARNV
mgnify:CR=1 FL=1